ncbi:MAG: CDP-archaeol synthase [Ruminococcus sp.]|nr:CDP-archaeol synthase [Ruminococcus sp.]
MKTRVITAAIAAAIAIVIIVVGSFVTPVLTVAICLVSALLCGELLSARKLHKKMVLFIPSLLFAILIPALSATEARYIPLYIFVLGMCIMAVVLHKTVRTDDIIFAVAGVVLITVSLSTLNILVWEESAHSAFWVIFSLGVPWIADTAAYFVGNKFGKHKLCPEISPHKTVEGAIAGVLGGTLSALLFGLIFQLIYGNVTIFYGVLLMVGFINSIVSIFGDLVFSVIKRSCKIKDYGSIMPGHGGLLDRFDSVLFCLPLVYIFSQFFYFCL